MAATPYLSYDRLMARARDPAADLTQAFAGVLSRFHTLGLPGKELARLIQRFFPGDVPLLEALADDGENCYQFRQEEHADLVDLLLEYRTQPGEESAWLAHTVATACLGENHLWQDMGLSDRDKLSALLATHFTSLYVRNTANMKWKKFFYKQLCERADVNLCKAPTCAVCMDYAACFGPEDGQPLPANEVRQL
jgi:nitrogen fixation protein NifQ